MLETLLVFALGICCIATLRKWWVGVWLCTAVGFLQDPLRKIIPGEPVYMVTLCAAVFVAVIAGLLLRKYHFNISAVPGWNMGFALALKVFLFVVCVQLVMAYINSNSLFIVGLGALTYLTPILAILAGFYFACPKRPSLSSLN